MTSSGRRANGWRQDDDPCLRWRVTAVVRVCAFMTLMLVTSATALPPTWSKPYGHGRDKQLQLGMPQASQPANRCSLSCPEGSRSPSKAAVCSWGTLLVLGRTNGGCSSSRIVVHGIAAHLKSAANLTPEPLCHEPHTHTACSPFDGLPLCAESADKPAKDRERFVLCHTPQLLPPQPPATRFEQHLRKLLPPCQNTSAWQWMACANTQAENTTCRDRYTLCRPILPSTAGLTATQPWQLATGKRHIDTRPAPLNSAPHAKGKQQIKLLLGQPPPKLVPPSHPHPAKCDRRDPYWTMAPWTLMQLHVATLATTTVVWFIRQWTAGHGWVALSSTVGGAEGVRLMHAPAPCELVKTAVKMVDAAVIATMAAMRAGLIIHMTVCTVTLYCLVCSECYLARRAGSAAQTTATHALLQPACMLLVCRAYAPGSECSPCDYARSRNATRANASPRFCCSGCCKPRNDHVHHDVDVMAHDARDTCPCPCLRTRCLGAGPKPHGGPHMHARSADCDQIQEMAAHHVHPGHHVRNVHLCTGMLGTQ